MTFEANPASVRAARRFAAEVLVDEGRPDLVRPATLVVSELATNAVRHARSRYQVDVHVDRQVAIGVSDTGPGEPTRLHIDVTALAGRGLAIIESVCRAWGVEPRPLGKRVWCVLDDDAEPGVSPG